jgi:hypothetical protein
MVDERVKEGQLGHCPLTFRDLQLIKEAFMNVLMGIYHHRVEYPEDKTQQTTEADSKAEVDSKAEADSKAEVDSKAETNNEPENNEEPPSSDEPANSEPTKQ